MVLRQDSLYCGTLNMVDVEQSVVGGLPVASSKPLGCRAEAAAHHCVTGGCSVEGDKPHVLPHPPQFEELHLVDSPGPNF